VVDKGEFKREFRKRMSKMQELEKLWGKDWAVGESAERREGKGGRRAGRPGRRSILSYRNTARNGVKVLKGVGRQVVQQLGNGHAAARMGN